MRSRGKFNPEAFLLTGSWQWKSYTHTLTHTPTHTRGVCCPDWQKMLRHACFVFWQVVTGLRLYSPWLNAQLTRLNQRSFSKSISEFKVDLVLLIIFKGTQRLIWISQDVCIKSEDHLILWFEFYEIRVWVLWKFEFYEIRIPVVNSFMLKCDFHEAYYVPKHPS